MQAPGKAKGTECLGGCESLPDLNAETRTGVFCKELYAFLPTESSLRGKDAFLFRLSFPELNTEEDGLKAVGLNSSNILVFNARVFQNQHFYCFEIKEEWLAALRLEALLTPI